MYKKLKNIVCHPSRLGMYFLDKPITIFGWFFSFFLIAILFVSGVSMHKESLNYEDSETIAGLILGNSPSDAEFDGTILKGTKSVIEANGVTIYFNDNSFMGTKMSDELVLVMGSNAACVYYSQILLSKVTYEKLEVNPFDFQKIKSGDIMERFHFVTFIDSIVSSAELEYRSVVTISNISLLLVEYAIVFIAVYFSGFVVNPKIERKVRFKLSVYASLSYFIVTIMKVASGIAMVGYLSYLVPVVYAFLCFSHIRMIKVRG